MTDSPAAAPALKMNVRGLNFHYNGYHALRDIHLPIPERQVTALIGPSG